jgi:hypothetical protein
VGAGGAQPPPPPPPPQLSLLSCHPCSGAQDCEGLFPHSNIIMPAKGYHNILLCLYMAIFAASDGVPGKISFTKDNSSDCNHDN